MLIIDNSGSMVITKNTKKELQNINYERNLLVQSDIPIPYHIIWWVPSDMNNLNLNFHHFPGIFQ